jgi:hypothetical protein
VSKARLAHADPHRKHLLRRRLLIRWLDGIDGCAVVPFCGDLAIALGGRPEARYDYRYDFPGLYGDRTIYACDLDEEMVELAQKRLTDGVARVADANHWAFPDIDLGPVAVIDCDAWDQPWGSFRAAWENVEKAERVAIFWTTAGPMGVMVDGTLVHPDGSHRTITALAERQKLFYQYNQRVIWPWLTSYVEADSFRILDRAYYRRGMVDYGGCVVERERK